MSKCNINDIFDNLKSSATVFSFITEEPEEKVICNDEWEYVPVVHDEHTVYRPAPTVTGHGLGFNISSCPTPIAASRKTRGGNSYSYGWNY